MRLRSLLVALASAASAVMCVIFIAAWLRTGDETMVVGIGPTFLIAILLMVEVNA